jgi:hypothetical protein
MKYWHYPVRSPREELLDAAELPVSALHRNLKELALVNRWLGGYRISTMALQEIQERFNFHTLIDIGTGGGDTLQRLVKRLPEGIGAEGWDLKTDCITYARQNHDHPRIKWVVGDFRTALHSRAPGVLFHASLFFHHFPNETIRGFITEMTAAGHGLIINDLDRHRFARNSIAFITGCWPGASYLVRHDAPLSVERAFTTADWHALLADVPGIHYHLKYRRMFRHQICIWPERRQA